MNLSGRRFVTATLGCKINQYETQALAEAWQAAGAMLVAEADATGGAGPDLVLVNACAVTAKAVADARNLIRKLHRAHPGAEIVVTGCAAQVAADELRGLPGVARLVPQQAKRELLPEGGELAIRAFPRARAVLRVQDGCSHGCTYCIVPLARGRSVSRPADEVLAEARRLLASGHRELVVSGVNLRQWGRELPGAPDFWDLLARLDAELAPEWAGRARLRLSSLEPAQLGPKALEVMAAARLLCPHLHLSLQSGSPAVLRGMGRAHYAPADVLGFLDRLGSVWPLFGLGADLLVGFPGETEAQFEETVAFCRDLPLSYAHVFPYSIRPGTRAAGMPDQVAPPEKKRRAARLRGLAARRRQAFAQRLAGLAELEVAVQDAGGAGVSQYYAACRLAPGGWTPGGLVRARPEGLADGLVLCRMAGPGKGGDEGEDGRP
ncbi:MAG: MiaB/RimO family radical SAM methylthiotransferase [Desulfovibrionaceae bacterium]